MKILYGLCGEGMGHATRSSACIRHLQSLGHNVLAVAGSSKAATFVRRTCSTLEIPGLTMACTDGAMDLGRTITDNIRQLSAVLGIGQHAWSKCEAFQPNAVITDYDPFSALFARAHNLFAVSIDNAQILPRAIHPPDIMARTPHGFQALSTVSQGMVPGCQHYIITSFFYPPIRSSCVTNTTLIPPILRPAVLERLSKPRQLANHVVVYKTPSLDDATMLQALGKVDAQFLVYGCHSDAAHASNVTLRSFSEAGFLEDMATTSGLISNAGMSLTGEALAFGVPLLAVPVRDQFEQMLNACWIAKLGYGAYADTLTATALDSFLRNRNGYRLAIQACPQHDKNRLLCTILQRFFGNAALT